MSPQEPELIDRLPILQRGLNDVPEPLLRRLFDTFRLVASYDNTANRLRCTPDGFRTRDLRLERAVS